MAAYDDDKLLSEFDAIGTITGVDRIPVGDGDDPTSVLVVELRKYTRDSDLERKLRSFGVW